MNRNNVTLRQLRAFVLVADKGSFVAAAETLALSQPALSHSIQQLEEQIGSALFHRTTRSVKLTGLGMGFLPTARHLLRQIDTSIADIQEAAARKRGRVVVACLPNPATLGDKMTGKTCVGVWVKGKDKKTGKPREVFIYNVCDHKACYEETGQHAIFYTAGVPPIAAARLIANGTWNPKTMVSVEELDPVPFLGLLNEMGLPTKMRS